MTSNTILAPAEHARAGSAPTEETPDTSRGDIARIVTLVPVAVASGLILASAARVVRDDIDAVRTESALHAAAAAAQSHDVNRQVSAAALW